MKKFRKLNSHGFSAVEGLLVLIIIALLVFIGWYVWHNHAKNKIPAIYTPPAAPNVKETPKKVTVDSYVGWKTIQSSDKSMSIKIPASWINTPCNSSTDINISSTKATAAVCNSGNIGEAMFISDTKYGPDTSFHKYSNNVVTTTVTINSVVGKKVTYTLSSDVPGAGAGTKGTKVIEYNFNKGGKGFYANYFQHPGGPDDAATFNKIVKSWVF